MNKLSDKIIGQIKEKKLKPLPKVIFWLRDITMWLLFALAIFIGAAALSVIFFAIFGNSEIIFEDDQISKLEFYLAILPLAWILIFLVFIGLTIYVFKHTKHGYRFSLPFIIGLNLLMSFTLAIGFFLGGGSAKFEAIIHHEKFMPSRQERIEDFFVKRGEEILEGRIIKFNPEEKNFILEDKNATKWTVILPRPIPFEKIAKNQPIRIIGIKKENNIFEAKRIMPAREIMEQMIKNRLEDNNVKRELPIIRSVPVD